MAGIDKKIFNQIRSDLINIMNGCFEKLGRYDISSDIYSEDLFDDIELIGKYTDFISKTNSKIIDVGCGKGHLTVLISQLLNKAVVGVDLADPFGEGGMFNKENLGKGWQKKCWEIFNDKYGIDYLTYDGQKLPFGNESIDMVIAYAVLEHVDDEQGFLQELNRVLKKGGYLMIFRCPSYYSLTERVSALLKIPHHDRLYKRNRLLDILRNSGFSVKYLSLYDTFPAFIPIDKFQYLWNYIFPLFIFIRRLVKYSPFIFISHHFKCVCQKIK